LFFFEDELDICDGLATMREVSPVKECMLSFDMSSVGAAVGSDNEDVGVTKGGVSEPGASTT